MSGNGEIYTTGKKFTLPPALTAVTNLTSDYATHIAASTLAALPHVIVSDIVFDVSIRLPPHPREGRQDKGVVGRREVTMLPLRKLGSG